ncbi:DNA polymerase III subunit delta [Acidihalobacter ferrooxydans]|uniref:DNA polymerase III subunit delta n=1 Tax=Acidihalobacter ferrooxydans TaxID=1765967 RepID=A0A1P8UI65_9GAMM|nr:DNA polymerase III subunit delta [Acidihalobacter ferrooxydans]APZ43517.1 DNA polymerase III subunit delta [Acidihalobacter ferrooxydans]
MPLKPRQLEAQLRTGLKPAYLLSGDEPLQLGEAADAVRRAAREQGYTERVVLTLEPGFDWNRLADEAASMSLFAERRLIELRLGTGKPGQPGGAALLAYLERPPEDAVLLIQSARLERSTTASRWVKALEKVGTWVAVWPLGPAETRQWLSARLRARGLEPDDAALTLLLDRVEGNLLAAAQEVEKLSLLRPPGALGGDAVVEAVTGNARYEVSDLAEAALAGDGARAVRVLEGLRGEGVEPTLVAWSLVREARLLAQLARGTAGDGVWRGVPPRRRSLVERASKRWPAARAPWLVRLAARADRVIKGQAAGDPWDELLQLSLVLSGRALFPPATALAVETKGLVR